MWAPPPVGTWTAGHRRPWGLRPVDAIQQPLHLWLHHGRAPVPGPQDCRFTQSADGKRLYLHLFAYPFAYLGSTAWRGKVDYVQFLHDASEVCFTEGARWIISPWARPRPGPAGSGAATGETRCSGAGAGDFLEGMTEGISPTHPCMHWRGNAQPSLWGQRRFRASAEKNAAAPNASGTGIDFRRKIWYPEKAASRRTDVYYHAQPCAE